MAYHHHYGTLFLSPSCTDSVLLALQRRKLNYACL